MSGRALKEKLAKGGRVFGTFFQYTTNPAVVDVLPNQGLDFVIVNVEHNHLDLADYMALRHALRAKGIACLARSHSHDPFDIARICDAFDDGVVVPYVEDARQLKRLVAAAKCCPLKGAALEHLIETGRWPSEATRQYIEQRCANRFFAAMIESAEAMSNLEAICAVPGIDALFVGPNDLTVSMGIPEERDHTEFVGALQKLIDTAGKHGIAAGAHFSKLSHAQRLIQQGGRFIPFSSDLRLIQAGVPEFLGSLCGGVKEGEEKVI